jgi:hypothetical protein
MQKGNYYERNRKDENSKDKNRHGNFTDSDTVGHGRLLRSEEAGSRFRDHI